MDLRHVEALQPQLARDVSAESGHDVPDIVRIIEMCANELGLVLGQTTGMPVGSRPRTIKKSAKARPNVPSGSLETP